MWKQPPIDLSRVPAEPGVYQMLDKGGQVLYVGKARNLKKRVSSYFQRRPEATRIQAMVQGINDVQMITTDSEAAALLLEHNLIKQIKPKYNILLRDNKTYPYLLLTEEDYPRLLLYRGHRDKKGSYFGPFPNAGMVRIAMHSLQKAFRIRDCEDAVFRHRSRPCMQHQIGRCTAPCCACVSREDYADQAGQVSRILEDQRGGFLRSMEDEMRAAAGAQDFEQAAALRDRIQALRSIAAGSDSDLPENADAIICHRHESGIHLRIGVRRNGHDLGAHDVPVRQGQGAEDEDILCRLFMERYRTELPPEMVFIEGNDLSIHTLESLLKLLHPECRSHVLIPQRGSRAKWLAHLKQDAARMLSVQHGQDQASVFEALAEMLHLPEIPASIAAIDHAHMSGTQMVSGIVYAGHGGADKDHYRHYHLKETPGGDDCAAMREALGRYFRALNEAVLPTPDLLLIDGGKGQLKAAITTATESGISGLRMLAVSKGESRRVGEEMLWPGWCSDGRYGIGSALKPGRHEPALLLIARVRDEAHRFAGHYLKKRRKKQMFSSVLDGIQGVGNARRSVLLRHFGGIQGVKRASREQLAQVSGVSSILAERIFTALHR